MKQWVIFSFLAFVAYFIVNFCFKFISGKNPFIAAFILYVFDLIIITVFVFSQHYKFDVDLKQIIITAVIALASITGTVFALKAINLAPNPGYSVAIFSSNFLLITIASIFIFGSELNIVKVLGMIATLIGLVLLSI